MDGYGVRAHRPLPRQPIGRGTYNLVVQLGNLRSATVPFILSEGSPPPPPDAPGPEHAPPP